jgi:hypothetical protein
MSGTPVYVILGHGRWSQVMHGVLTSANRRVVVLEGLRRQSGEDDDAYVGRLSTALHATSGQIAWICVPPVMDVRLMGEAAIRAGLSMVLEKPWRGSAAETFVLSELARKSGAQIGVHYQYCFLKGVAKWRSQFRDADGLTFGGRFLLGREDRLGIPATENLGSHLLAIREYATPQAELAELSCAYNATTEERLVWIQNSDGVREQIDFLGNKENLIQRFVAAFEQATQGGETFALDLEFALKVQQAAKKKDVAGG